MTFVLADRVQETTTTTGTGTLTLAGAVAQFQSFSAGIGANNVTYYGLLDGNGTDWETGIGTVGSGGTTLARTTVLESSNSNSAISLSSNTHTVYCNQPAAQVARTTPNVPPASIVSWVNQTSATITSYTNGPLVYMQAAGSGNNYISAALFPISHWTSSASWTATVCLSIMLNDYPQPSSFGISDGTKFGVFTYGPTNNGNQYNSAIFQQDWNSYNSYDSQNADIVSALPQPFWLQITYVSATSITYSYSMDGFSWVQAYQDTGIFLTPTYLFLGCDTDNTAANQPNYISCISMVVA